MAKLTKTERHNAFKNFSIILGLMAVIYLIAFFLWGIYEEGLKFKFYYPYIKIKDNSFKSIKNFPYKSKNTSIKIDETEFSNIYDINTKFGNSEIRSFDNRFFFFENEKLSIIAYPSYEFRGLEYQIFKDDGKQIKLIVVPNESTIDNIFDFLNNIEDVKRIENIDKYDFIKIDEGKMIINSYKRTFILPSKDIKTMVESDEFIYLLSNDLKDLNKIYIINKENHIIKELIISEYK
ncbi:hypothetical protein OF820_13275 [Oceanotoga sp. DSM 15011]|uniref:hypothetical protein n=1 Tax=Oceanotoga sp. DSM 15011 TaxID=2984951 RepID=UPI0021F4DEC9|nr:hypothetical protein [Oceanotoga sp. DSM 15011]UYP00004.1 hypothetical protein OF820_13275 [Oceanotoga sp. DSM 15011]